MEPVDPIGLLLSGIGKGIKTIAQLIVFPAFLPILRFDEKRSLTHCLVAFVSFVVLIIIESLITTVSTTQDNRIQFSVISLILYFYICLVSFLYPLLSLYHTITLEPHADTSVMAAVIDRPEVPLTPKESRRRTFFCIWLVVVFYQCTLYAESFVCFCCDYLGPSTYRLVVKWTAPIAVGVGFLSDLSFVFENRFREQSQLKPLTEDDQQKLQKQATEVKAQEQELIPVETQWGASAPMYVEPTPYDTIL
eukprot:gnl/Dysnectes_brevis/6474_a10065_447.p1 GENE.gnl/Dysnectes_brevis/6474_a10065_447~~gnl/Dysnectes_brevis/6474_a10065_447.p1  ORF type:complete len:268 (-),score=-1.83 gnl/Dysnectes_brevis/6474_a10065_447:35-784(-)